MRLMLIHADRFSFKVTEETSVAGFAGELAPGEDLGHVEEALVAFVAVEKADESSPQDMAEQTAARICAIAEKVGAERVMVYPYAHLSSDLAKPRIAAEVIGQVVEQLRAGSALEIRRAPFGFYKAFDISCKGHPLSEVAMTLIPGGGNGKADRKDEVLESKALAAEQTLRSEWRVYQPDGSFVPADKFNFDAHQGLKDLFGYEREGTRLAEDAPTHIKLMREHELVDYEPASDAGNLRWYPKGTVVKRLLEQSRLRCHGGRDPHHVRLRASGAF
jgi:threonyl-tRNA synthetase